MWKLYVSIILILGAFGSGWYYGHTNSVTQIVETEKINTVIKDRIVTRIVERKPDGTIIETNKEEDINHSSSSKNNKSGSSQVATENYRVSAAYWVRSSADVLGGLRGSNTSFAVSRRITRSLWGEAQARPFGDRKEVAVGLGFQW